MTATALQLSPLVSRRTRLWPLVIVSLVVHVALIVGAVIHRPAPQLDLQQKPIVAKLVRLGQKRPEQWLPRKEAAPPPAAAAPTPAPVAAVPSEVKSVPLPVAKPAPAPAKSAPTRGPTKTGRTDVLASVMSKIQAQKRDEPVWGDPSGDPRGDSSEGSPGDQYLALVERALRDSYTLPATISEKDRMYLKATVVLYLDSDGTLLRYAFETRSGNGAFDSALERAIRAARLPPPPPELRNKYRSEGLGVLYRP